MLKTDFEVALVNYEAFKKTPLLASPRCNKLCLCIDPLKSFRIIVLLDILQLIIIPRTILAILILCCYGKSKKHINNYITMRKWTWILILLGVLAGLVYTSYEMSFEPD